MKISDNHNVYMELTNSVHGGEGWDFGEVLWSPVSSPWNIMKDVKAGDIIIHSLKKAGGHRIVGASVVKRSAVIVNDEPLKPGKWEGYDQYYRIEVQKYSNFPKELKQKDFFNMYETDILALGDQHSFYALSENKTHITGAAQKYLAILPDPIQELLMKWFKTEGVVLFSDVEIDDDDDNDSAFGAGTKVPGRVKTTQLRIVRDTDMIKKMKKTHDNICQICGKKIMIPNGKGYSEGHHLQKLGGIHKGPDIKENVIILCPYHHTEFDYGSIAINPDTLLVEHIDTLNEYHGKKLAYERKDLGKNYLTYHYKNLFNK